jgi:hypothetical protein
VNAFDLKKFRSNKPARTYVTAHGKRIAVETLPSRTPAARRRKAFQVRWVKLPAYWIECLDRSKSANTLKLANHILREAYKREQIGGDIILSTKVTGLPRQSRSRAIKEMVKLNLIEVEQCGNRAARVTRLLGVPRPYM